MIEATRDTYVYTDCTLLGDEGLKKVKLLSYDENKYCWVEYKGITDDVKSGYIYNYNNFNKELKWVCPYKLILSRKEYSNYLKGERHKTTYQLLVTPKEGLDERLNFNTLSKALNYFKSLDDNLLSSVYLLENIDRFNQRGLVVLENDELYCVINRGEKDSRVKSRHIGKRITFKQRRK